MRDPVVLRTRRRRQRLVALGLAGALAVVVAAVQVARALSPGTVEVKLDPADAMLQVDGQLVYGRPPLTVPRGVHRFTALRPGYETESQDLEVAPRERHALVFRLVVSPDTGVEISSDPEGALIWLDGSPVVTTTGAQAETSYIITRVRPGKHMVELRLGGKSWRQEINVQPEKIVPVNGKLRP
jgi:hypothetical protein